MRGRIPEAIPDWVKVGNKAKFTAPWSVQDKPQVVTIVKVTPGGQVVIDTGRGQRRFYATQLQYSGRTSRGEYSYGSYAAGGFFTLGPLEIALTEGAAMPAVSNGDA